MTIADKLIRAKTDYDEVYEAGKQEIISLHPEKTASGSYISVDDVSELPHSVACKVESVNLLNPDNFINGEFVEYNGVSCYKYSDNENFFVYNGTFKENTQYTATVKMYREGENAANIRFQFDYTDGTFDYIMVVNGVVTTYTTRAGKTIDKIRGFYNLAQMVYIDLSATCLHEGTEALPYTPYVSPESVTVTRCGANLWKDAKTFEIVGNGTAKQVLWASSYEGTTTKVTFSCYANLQDVKYAESGNLIYLTVQFTNGTSVILSLVTDISSSGLIQASINSSNTDVISRIGINAHNRFTSGTVTLSNVMLFGTATAQTLTPNADGTVEGMTSVYPQMNIFADNADAMLDVTYRVSKGKRAEYDAFWDGFQQNGTRTNYNYAFFDGASKSWNEITFTPKYQIKPTEALSICQGLAVRGDVTKVADFDFSKAKIVMNAFAYAGYITRLGVMDLRAVNQHHIAFCANCYELETIDDIILKDDGTQFNSSATWEFTNCTSLKNVKITGVIPFNVNFRYSPLAKASITSVINALSTTVTGQTATFQKSAKETAFTADEWAALIGTKPNWTFSLV